MDTKKLDNFFYGDGQKLLDVIGKVTGVELVEFLDNSSIKYSSHRVLNADNRVVITIHQQFWKGVRLRKQEIMLEKGV